MGRWEIASSPRSSTLDPVQMALSLLAVNPACCPVSECQVSWSLPDEVVSTGAALETRSEIVRPRFVRQF